MAGSTDYILFYVFFLLGTTAFALLMNSIMLRFMKTSGTKNQNVQINRWSAQTKPAVGGLTFYILFLFSFTLFSLFFESTRFFTSGSMPGLIASTTLAFVMGLADDAYNTRPFLKFVVQVICGLIFFVSGLEIQLFHQQWLNAFITVFWVVGLMNSINMLDNMDGVAAVVCINIILAAIVLLIFKGDFANTDLLIFTGLLAGLIAFLFYNWYPSKMFMGDTGSQMLGVILAYIGIKYCWNAPVAESFPVWQHLLLAGLVFLLPLSDTTTVTINRLFRGQSPFVGGRDHTTHSLSYLGISDANIARIFFVLGLISILIYWLVSFYSGTLSFGWHLIFASWILVVFLSLFVLTRFFEKKHRP